MTPNPKLSDILKLYYERPGSENIPVKAAPEYYSFSNRWLIACQFLNLVTINGNTITWLPDDPNSEWVNGTVDIHDPQHYFSFENKACLVEKMKNFTLFWLNREIIPYVTGVFIVKNIFNKKLSIKNFDDVVIAYPNSQTEETAFYTLANYILNNHFLPFLKSHLIDEQVGKQIV